MKKIFTSGLFILFFMIAGNFQVSAEDNVWVSINGNTHNLSQIENSDSFEGTITFASDGQFSIFINDTEYGFTSYSGNGGVGTVNSNFSAVPYYNGGSYYVEKSIGLLSAEGNLLWVNTGQGGDVYVRVDSVSTAVPRYYVKIKVAEDANCILREHFDLFVWGGDWVQVITGTNKQVDPEELDGTEAGLPDVASRTSSGTNVFCNNLCSEYLVNRDLSDWGAEYIVAFPGYIRLSTTASSTEEKKGKLVSPALSKLEEPSIITVEFDICRFSALEDFYFQVEEGNGVITKGEYSDEETPLASMYFSTDTKVAISTNEAPEWVGVNGDIKYFTHFKFTVSGATSETKLAWDATNVSTSKQGRVCIDNVDVTLVEAVTGIGNFSENTINIYPTLVTNNFYVNGLEKRATLKLFNLNGKILFNREISDNQKVPTNSLSKGIYIVEVDAGTQGKNVTKIIKQ